ncbi:MAG TPA: hypothetical protein VNO30_36710 [Kofleriaceae bacterium]|nr:hypothetical protein [Kofleriaceae bacterium]
MLATSVSLSGYATARNKADLRRYFEHTLEHPVGNIELESEGRKAIPFGEYLVEQGLIDRCQLLLALQLQDQRPGLRLGEAATALGFATRGTIERMFARFRGLGTVD